MPFDDYHEIAKAMDAKARQVDREDYGKEGTGWPTGKMARFFKGAASVMAKAEERRAEDFHRLIRTLDELMRDPVYVLRREEFRTFLVETQSWLDERVAAVRDALAEIDGEIDQMLASAPRLPDGRRVFRFADGRVIDENGDAVSAEQAAGIVWPETETSAEAYLAAINRRADLLLYLERLEEFRINGLGTTWDRFNDEQHGMTIDEFETFEAELRRQQAEIENKMPAYMSEHTAQAHAQTVSSESVASPKTLILTK